MAANTKIEWCDHTFNPWLGCTKVSPACDYCYAESWAKRTGHPELWQGHRRRTSEANWRLPLKWDRDAATASKHARVFCASLADVFDNQVPLEWRVDLWTLIAETPHLDWLLLTKRPQNIAKMLPGSYVEQLVSRHLPWPWPNVWLGTTAENQEEADRRIPVLLQTPAAVRFVSLEPLLGPIDLTQIDDGSAHREVPREEWGPLDDDESPPALWWDALSGQRTIMHGGVSGDWDRYDAKLDWVICGGESGPHARPMHPDWARSIRDQCQAAGVPFFFKQWGEHAPYDRGRFALGRVDEPIQKFGKKRAGRLLDGREWNETPR